MKSYVGIDIGHDRLKLVYIKDKKIAKIVIEPMIDNLVKDGRILSPEACGNFIKEIMQKYRIKCTNAALMVSENCMYVKNVTMPQMPGEQILCNLPYEFRDYISEKDSSFLFDYAILAEHESQPVMDETGTPTGEMSAATVDLMAVAISKEIMEGIQQTIKAADMKLIKAAPEIVIYREFIRRQPDFTEEKEQCILDLGYNATRMYMFKGTHLMGVRIIDRSIRNIERIVAEFFGVDVHLAGAYLKSNYQGCQTSSQCIESYEALALEIARALKFYKFSNQESELENILIWGGGSGIAPLVDAIRNTVTDMHMEFVSDYLPESAAETNNMALMALGVAYIPDGREAFKPFQKIKAGKTVINLAMIGYKPFNYKVAVPASIIIVILAVVLSKFAVVDRLNEINRLKGELTDIRLETKLYKKQIKDYGSLVETYAHYTYEDFDEEELKRADRADMIALINQKIAPRCQVGDWSIVENTLTISVVCHDLKEVNAIASSVKKDEQVDYCTVSTAASSEQNGNDSDSVTGTMEIVFKDGALYDKVDLPETDDTAEDDSSTAEK